MRPRVALPTSGIIRVALYLRLSKEDLKGKVSNVDSIATQRADGIEAIHRQPSWSLDEARHIFIDDDVSGRLVKRDGWSEMLAAAARGEFTILVVRDQERLARYEPARQMKTFIELLDMGVRVWTYKDMTFLRLSGPESIITYAKAIASEQYVETIRTNTKAALKRRLLAGQAVKRPPYGYKIEDRGKDGPRWAIVDAKVAEVIRIAELTLEAGSKNAAVKKLNAMGMRAPAGGPWRIPSLTQMLSHPLYRGVYHHGGETVLHPELRIFDHALEARLDEFLSKKAKPWGSTPRHLSTRFVRCGLCSGALIATCSSRSTSRSMACDLSRLGGCKGIGYRPETRVDAALLSAVGAVVTDEMWGRVKAVLRQGLEAQREAGRQEAEVERIKREMGLAERRISNLTEGLAEADDDVARAPIVTKLKAETARRAALATALAKAEANVPTATPESILGEAERRVHELRDLLAKGGMEALPAVKAILGDEKFKAMRTPEGWEIKARISTAHVFEVSSTQRSRTATRRTRARRRTWPSASPFRTRRPARP